jgi:hypothetical protein
VPGLAWFRCTTAELNMLLLQLLLLPPLFGAAAAKKSRMQQ